jgi:hypothetical protein
MTQISLAGLLEEYDRALAYTHDLWTDLTADEVRWRAGDDASSIGWHVGHQAAVAHYMVRNLTAAELPIDTRLDALMDSATPEDARGEIPDREQLAYYRNTIAGRVRFRVGNINSGNVGAPIQLRVIARTLMVAVINHEYQHSKWIGELRTEVHGRDLPVAPASDRLTLVEGYFMVETELHDA